MPKFLETVRDSLSPLRLRNMRIYLGGQAISLIGTWMQHTAQAWVVWELTRSTKALGEIALAGTIPLLILGPWTGAWADRLDRRKVLIATQAMAALLAIILAILVQTDLVQLWHVFALATALGVTTALDFPCQQAFIGDLSGVDQVRKAVVINATLGHVSRMLGPALSGFVVGSIGAAPAFWVNGLSFLAVIWSLMVITSNQTRRPSSGRPLSEFVEGLRFIKGQPRMQDLLLFAAFVTVLGLSNFQIMPAVADTVLGGGAGTYGLLMGAQGAGALAITFTVLPVLQRARYTGRMLTWACLWVGAWFVIFSFSRWLPLSTLCTFMAGAGVPVVLTTCNGLIQTLAPANMRGRLITTFLMISFGLTPVAAFVVGHSAALLGPTAAVRANGIVLISGALLLIRLRPELRRWEAHVHDRLPGGQVPGARVASGGGRMPEVLQQPNHAD